MKKEDYIEKAKNTILNRVRFHAPVVYDDNIDKTTLFVHGINVEKPIFKFDKVLNKRLLKAFVMAQKEEEFNLLLSVSSLSKIKESKLKPLSNAIVYSSQNSSVSFVEMVNKLNINYQSSSNYNLVFKDKFFKVNDEILNPHYREFMLRQKLANDEVWVDYNEFILNGNNYLAKFTNKGKKTKNVKIELNIPLKKGYYYFKKLSKCVVVENLMSKEKLFLNFVCNNCKFSFSNVDGLENSVYCCINVKLSFSIEPTQEKHIFFNLGDSKFCLNSIGQIKAFRDLSERKCCEIFNVQVKTKNPNFDLYFNHNLPKKIWIDWLNNEVDASMEEKYLSLKRMFVKGSENFSLVNFKEIGLKEIGVFNGEYYKKILVVGGDEKYLKVGKTFFYNINGITNHSLKSKEPIMLSFGE